MMKRLNEHAVSAAYRAAETKLLILNFDTVLAVQDNPAHVNVDALLSHLSLAPGARVIVTSSHTPWDMSMLVREPRVIAIAENGGFIRRPGALWEIMSDDPLAWKGPIFQALSTLAENYPGSRVEEKHFSIRWWFGIELAENDHRQLSAAFRTLSSLHEVPLIERNDSIIFHAPAITKSKAILSWLKAHGPYSFILVIGGGKDEEEVFDMIHGNSFTLRVGYDSNSCAAHYLPTQNDALAFLTNLAVGY